jgi:hypothetical protein
MINGILYEISNSITNKKYIGVTKTKLKERWDCHLYKLRRGKSNEKIQFDFNKYGESTFSIKEISNGVLSDMFLKEKELTKETILYGYNVIAGGNEKDDKIQAFFEYRKKLNENPDFRKKISEKISVSNKGKLVTLETRKKISESKKGVKWNNDERKKEISKKYLGINNPNYGKYSIFLNKKTGIYYNSVELMSYFNKNKSGIQWLRKIKNPLLNDFVKV